MQTREAFRTERIRIRSDQGVFAMRIAARGAATAVIGPAILAGPLALAPSASAVDAAPPARATAPVAHQAADAQMLRTPRPYTPSLPHLHTPASHHPSL